MECSKDFCPSFVGRKVEREICKFFFSINQRRRRDLYLWMIEWKDERCVYEG